MMHRAWYVLAVVWAFLLFGIFGLDASNRISWGFLLIALSPLAVPTLLRCFFSFVLTGSPRRPGPVRAYRPRP